MEGSRDTALRFLKISSSHLPTEIEENDGEQRTVHPLRTIHDIGTYSAIFVPGISPSFIIKSASSVPHVISLKGEVIRSLSGFNTSNCEQGFCYIDAQVRFLNMFMVSSSDEIFSRARYLRQDFRPRAST